jgi:acid phosphatase (class A)
MLASEPRKILMDPQMRYLTCLTLLCSLLMPIWASAAAQEPREDIPRPEPVPEVMHGILQGYLAQEDYPDSLAMLPPPPAKGSPAQATDDAISQRLLELHDSPRFQLATLDNDLSFPNAAGTFSCALGVAISDEQTPYLYQLLRRSLTDAGLATYAAKNHYDRARPFTVNESGNCAPEREQEMLRGDPSYPSGHTAIGWAWALILTSLAPDRADELLARGMAYGESRAFCNVHWPSDVAAGRTVGAAAVAVLNASDAFQHDLAEARRELEAVWASGAPPSRDCRIEQKAMTVRLFPRPAE